MKVEKPIFIIGIGRSGSTVIHRLLAKHPNIAWLSGFCKRYPDRPGLNRMLMHALDAPVVGPLASRKFSPWECHDFWEHHSKGFRRSCRDLLPQDVSLRTRRKMPAVFEKMLTPKRHRLMLKATGWPRIGYIHEIFNDAKFIHVLRDGRAVANSMINVEWWLGWQGPQNWRWGDLTPAQREEWESHDRSYVALAAIQWKIAMEAVENGRRHINDGDFFEMRYEELCADPLGVIERILDFAGLATSRGFEKAVTSLSLRNMNDRWRAELTGEQQRTLETVLMEKLQEIGYS